MNFREYLDNFELQILEAEIFGKELNPVAPYQQGTDLTPLPQKNPVLRLVGKYITQFKNLIRTPSEKRTPTGKRMAQVLAQGIFQASDEELESFLDLFSDKELNSPDMQAVLKAGEIAKRNKLAQSQIKPKYNVYDPHPTLS